MGQATLAIDWQRSKRGNLWTAIDGRTVTVFRRPDRRFGVCVANRHGPVFSQKTFRHEAAAVRHAEKRVGVRHD